MIPIRFIKNVPIPIALIALLLFLSLFTSCDQSNSQIGKPTLAICQGQVDSDQDGVCDILENQIGTNPLNPNTDSPVDPFPDGADFNPTNDGSAFTNSGNQSGWLPLGILSGVGLVIWAKNNYLNGEESIDSDPNDGEDGTDTTHPKSDKEIAENGVKAGKIDFDASFIRFLQIPNDSSSQGILVTWVVATAENIHYVHLGIESYFNHYPEIVRPDWSVTSPARDTVNYQLNPKMNPNLLVATSERAKAAFKAVESGDLNRIRDFNGEYLWREVINDPEGTYQSFDPEGLGYRREFNGWISNSLSNAGYMQFLATELGHAFSPLSGNYPSPDYIDLDHPCSVANHFEYFEDPYHVNRCLMYTFDKSSPDAARTWVRTEAADFPAAKEHVMPWEGIWARLKQNP